MLLINLGIRYFPNNKTTYNPSLKKLIQQIQTNSFISFINKVSIKKLKQIIESKKGIQFFLKLLFFNHICKLLIATKKKSQQTQSLDKVQTLCNNFIQLIINDKHYIDPLINSFVHSKTILTNEKLFTCQLLFPSILSTKQYHSIISQLETNHWKDFSYFENTNSRNK